MPPSDSRPKIALVVHDFDPTLGQGRYCHELVRRLHRDLQFEVHANTWTDPGVSGVLWRKVPAWRFNVITTIASYLPGAEASLTHFPADIIHAQGLSSWRADVITAHMCNGARRRHLRGAPWRSRCFAGLITPVERAFYRQRRASHLIAIARALGREVQTEYGWNRAMHVIYHGTDCDRFRPARDRAERRSLQQRFQLPENRWLWLFMGEAVKGLAQSIQQLPVFPEAQLLVVSRSQMEAYRQQAMALGVLNRITFHGFDPKPEEAFRAVDVFLYPNDYDPFGLVVTEAMASGLPTVVGRGIGAAELVEHERDGLLCDPQDSTSITTSLRFLQSNPAAAAKLGVAARLKAQYHSWDRCAQETFRVYEQVLRERPIP